MASSGMMLVPFFVEILHFVRKILRGQERDGTATSDGTQLQPLSFILLL
jgi:hypothetical protein